MSNTFQNLEALRNLMRRVGVDAVIIPGTDPHMSEYVSEHYKVRDWVSGFTGSNGTAVVTLTDAGLWTDSRYFLQAEMQLEGSGFTLKKEDGADAITREQWLIENLPEDSVIAVDGSLFSVVEVGRLEEFCGNNGFRLATDFVPADRLWTDRPARPMGELYIHEEKYAGENINSKIDRLAEQLNAAGADGMLITALDDIAWLFNLRGSDVPYTPVFLSFAYIANDDRVLFVDEAKVSDEVRAHLAEAKVRVRDYDEVTEYLERLKEHRTVLIDPHKTSDALAMAMPCGKLYASSPIAMLKTIKNQVQIEGFRKAMERDGVALVRTFMWLEKMAGTGSITEQDVWNRAIEERKKSPMYRDDSFNMICAYKEHGAIIHYCATDESASTLHADGLVLIDTGAQYLDGTTDITRTISLGNPTAEEIHDYTLVLKGHLAMSRAQFPVGTSGHQLDALARIYQWEEGMTFFHGVGHGVGHFLGVHEGPQSIRMNPNPIALQPGMVTSNEPGIYKAGKHGVRIENLILCVEGAQTEEMGNFLKFETLTLCPYDTRLIDREMLTKKEINQINEYHAQVLSRLSPYLEAEEQEWLKARTAAI